MKLAIMQPYFLPYIGYFQLIFAADKFVIYDNIEFTKSGWIHRNRFLQNGKAAFFTVPLKKASDFLFVSERKISTEFEKERARILRRLENAYGKAPFYGEIFPHIKEIFLFEEKNLFRFIFNSVKKITEILDVNTEIIVSSQIDIEHGKKGAEKVLAICKKMDASEYINPRGGIALYDKEEFKRNGINLLFLFPKKIVYEQFDNEFVPDLSILDVLMFNGIDGTKKLLREYELK